MIRQAPKRKKKETQFAAQRPQAIQYRGILERIEITSTAPNDGAPNV